MRHVYIPVGPVISPLPTPTRYLSPFGAARGFEEKEDGDDDFARAVCSNPKSCLAVVPLMLEAKNMPNTSSDTREERINPVLRGAEAR